MCVCMLCEYSNFKTYFGVTEPQSFRSPVVPCRSTPSVLFIFSSVILQLPEEVPLQTHRSNVVPTSDAGRLWDPVFFCRRVYTVRPGYKLPAAGQPRGELHPAVSALITQALQEKTPEFLLFFYKVKFPAVADELFSFCSQDGQEIHLHCITVTASGKPAWPLCSESCHTNTHSRLRGHGRGRCAGGK